MGDRIRIAVSALLFLSAAITAALTSLGGIVLASKMILGEEPVTSAMCVVLLGLVAGLVTALTVLRRPECTLPRRTPPHDQ